MVTMVSCCLGSPSLPDAFIFSFLKSLYIICYLRTFHCPCYPEHKLFVGMLPKNVSEVEVSDLFSEYGNIKDLQILRGSQQTSKGTSFIILDFLLDWLLVGRLI